MRRMKKTFLIKSLYLLIIILFINFNLYATKRDSLLQNFIVQYDQIIQKNNFEKDTNYSQILEKLSAKYEFINIDSSIYFANKLKELSNKNGSEFDKMKSLNLFGNIYQTMNKNKEALNYYFQAYSIALKEKNIKYCTKISRAISFSYYYQGNYSEFLKYQNYSLYYAKKLNDTIILGESYTNLGISFGQINDYKNALENHIKAIDIFTKINDESHLASCCNNIGLIYLRLGNYDKALFYFHKAIELKKKHNIFASSINGG